mmetsp:Transcript_34091/g.80239  ORF Transcript_34091/g.80239 Transcript_34091/m.80239 type:complete len:219 (+) Transcript_34091:54-710(+)
MRNNSENLQHRRHRPMYIAPPAARLQHLSAVSNDSSENHSVGYNDDRDSNSHVKDLRIPPFVHIPQDKNLRIPIISPPSSNGSEENAPFQTTSNPLSQNWALQPTRTSAQHPGQYESSLSATTTTTCCGFGQRLLNALALVYYAVFDVVLLVFACIIGLFFHVEVHVVKHRSHRRRGRVIIQNDIHSSKREHYNSSELLRPVPPELTHVPYFAENEVV